MAQTIASHLIQYQYKNGQIGHSYGAVSLNWVRITVHHFKDESPKKHYSVPLPGHLVHASASLLVV